jgi:tRNA threonylcarbamoyladenosine modification (KEOPS) complex Cgi121 subunit
LNIIKVADAHALLACISNLQILDVTAFMNELRSVSKHVAVQVVNADFIAGPQHVLGILQQSMEAKKRGILQSRRIEIDILLRLACTDQIDRALTDIGLKDGTNNVLVIAVGRINHLKMLMKYIAANYDIDDDILLPSKRRLKFISAFHDIDKTELKTLVNDSNKIASILVEHASLL